jgi:hypothetical protein
VNVGDLKPYEMHTEFFLALGYDTARFTPDNLSSWRASWAAREFGLSSTKSQAVADIIGKLDKWNSNRKPELLNGSLYSLTNYREAETVLEAYKNLSDISTPIYNGLDSKYKPAFFQLVQHPVEASYTLLNMWISQGYNNLLATQAKNAANQWGSRVEDLFDHDYELETEYHTLLDGKWNQYVSVLCVPAAYY